METSQNARAVLEKRYFVKEEGGALAEDGEGMLRRVSGAVAAADAALGAPEAQVAQTRQEFYAVMDKLDFLPNSPTLMNAGRPLGQLSACFVLPVGDSMEEIFEAVKQAALIHKSGGGTGFSFTRLRPKGSTVRTTGGVASGPVSFMRVFNMATEAVKQGGTRRGANMGILRIDHPDILDFIHCKQDNGDITNFNISVGITEAFMRAVQAGEDYPLVDPHSGAEAGRLDADEVFRQIVESAWHNGEPGIIFLDRLNRDNVVPAQGEIESTNPCGEQPLLPYESCNLGSINLAHMLREEDGKLVVDEARLEKTVCTAVHFLDNVIEINKYPLERIDEATRATRKIGLGVMGFADMLLHLGLPYGSQEAADLAGGLMASITEAARGESIRLGRLRGSFPLFGESIFKDLPALRNGTVTTIAPTGTISMIAGCSSGVEPIFAYVFIRNVMDNTEMVEVNPVLKATLERRGLYSEGLMREIAQAGSLAHIAGIPEDIRRVFVCAHDIPPAAHLRIQAAFQAHVDNAVSKTVNFPHSATREDVAKAYWLAYELGCKGVTIYRDGSRGNQVLNIGAVSAAPAAPNSIAPRPRPAVTCGMTERMKIGCGNLYVTVNYDENGICEVFTSTGKAGGCPSQSEATARLASIALRSGVSVGEILQQLRGIRCPSTIRREGMSCVSCPDAIARVIQKVWDMLDKEDARPIPASVPPAPYGRAGGFSPAELITANYCPECGAPLEHEGGCVSCRACGYSKCR